MSGSPSQVVSVNFTIPTSKHFMTDHPEPIKLIPGMSMRVDITFKANVGADYQDELEFETPSGRFKVALIASRPATHVEVRDVSELCAL